ncbi:MAG TPA: type IV pilin N-terminal domain-containing protein [Methanoculleus sp.]|nr:type IV pilin N-terminal domain-containing protein [Methanoculleus sp.]
MMKFRENEDAVSPVIGVILMVAITVILAAVIAAFVFGMTGNVQTTKTVAVTANQNSNNVVLTYHGGADAATLQYLTITVTKGSDTTSETQYLWYDTSSSGVVTTNPNENNVGKLPVGTTTTIVGFASSQQDHVVVAGHFADGSDHVVLDTYV